MLSWFEAQIPQVLKNNISNEIERETLEDGKEKEEDKRLFLTTNERKLCWRQ